MNAHPSERLGGAYSRRHDDSTGSSFNAGNLVIALNKDISRYVHQQEESRANAPDSHWTKAPEVPDNEEVALMDDEAVVLAANKVKGKWKSKDKYLKAHFELFREDAISPLRNAVDKFKRDPDMMDNQNMSIYEKVHFIGFTFSNAGIAARIRFSTRRAQRRIPWEGSKRLVSGGIVALSPVGDNFQEKCIIAVVAARPLEGVKITPPEIDIFFIRPDDIEIDSQQEWIMLEARTGYYEAYRHTLLALQKLDKESFPLAQHICTMSSEIPPPAYLQENPIRDLSSATRPDSISGYGNVDVLQQWPGPEESQLDHTQWESLRQMLTKSLAVVQGPPGTGKTYVSTVALEILNRNTQPGDPPIIIAAQTNHALDQLLEHVSRFEKSYIRLGGRSSNPIVKQRSLFEIRSQQRINLIPGSLLGKAISSCHIQAKAMIKTLEPFHVEQNKPVSIDTFLKLGAISEKQAQSINAGSSRWVTADDTVVDPLQLWIGGSLRQFNVDYETEQFGFGADDDEDLEIEQLREHEAESGVIEEEDKATHDGLQGQWCSISNQFAVEPPSETDIREATRILDTSDDLWRTPQGLRGAIYFIMMQRLKESMLSKFRQQAEVYNRNLKDLKIGRWERDAVFLQSAKIIGMTTTGLSKYRPLISSLKPKIILIEEAAEVLEAPVTVACMDSVEHLILVGDHQQLQGHCSDLQLEGEPWYLDVSLFERLVRNEMPFTTLLRQRRMNPEFRRMLMPIYPKLGDHVSVEQRPARDWGTGKVRHFFFDHQWYESRDGQMSTYNEQEAEYVAGFYRWLVINGVPPAEVTILTLYNGQRKRLLKEIRSFPELKQIYNNVKTVDSYQGEENTIILLSLARHNLDYKIGFLENQNRVCVALSRAREGFYIFGSTSVLAKNELWTTIIKQMKAKHCVADAMPVVCKQHGTQLLIRNPEDWRSGVGGCDEVCGKPLPCGHPCKLQCHPFPHEAVTCAASCEKELCCGHTCGARCFEECKCHCEAFKWVQPKPTFSSADVRNEEGSEGKQDPGRIDVWMSGRYVSGWYASNTINPYLPVQATMSRKREPVDGTMEKRGKKTGRETRQDDRTWSGNTYGGQHPITEQESQRLWAEFADGGVVQDDHRRLMEWNAKQQQASGGKESEADLIDLSSEVKQEESEAPEELLIEL